MKLTKKQIAEFKAIAAVAEKLNRRIIDLFDATDYMNYSGNHQSIQYEAHHLAMSLRYDSQNIKTN